MSEPSKSEAERNGAVKAGPGTALVPSPATENGRAVTLAPPPAVGLKPPAAHEEPAAALKEVAAEAAAKTVEFIEEPAPAATPASAPSSAPAAGPTPRQARAASVLGGLIGGSFDFGAPGVALGAQGWWLFQWPALTVDAAPYRPALAGWRRERLPDLPLEAWPDHAPDWVCDIVSGPEEAEAPERAEIEARLARAGVLWLWVVDPVSGALEAAELSGGRYLRHGAFYGRDAVEAPPFHHAPFSLEALWPD